MPATAINTYTYLNACNVFSITHLNHVPLLHACLRYTPALTSSCSYDYNVLSITYLNHVPLLHACLHYTPASTTRLPLLHACLYYTPASTPATIPRSYARDCLAGDDVTSLLCPRLPPLYACLNARDVTSLSRPQHHLALTPATSSLSYGGDDSSLLSPQLPLLHACLYYTPASTPAILPRSHARDCLAGNNVFSIL
ncbi:hypothetical protein CC86DRAFT_383792 [Ophiobolus disseminans]|uniref:Uncharacterized protein n=1 Tax=Ophiobolus disseminans TaxID=1469910 RepID=A0A6A6ZXK7_9PLEO|nr:hypothetical protein CC86DRAFT_383792 [Ophiobolus disseminans]